MPEHARARDRSEATKGRPGLTERVFFPLFSVAVNMPRPRVIERCRDYDDDLGPPLWKPMDIKEEKTKPKWVQDMGDICAGLYKDYCAISNPFSTTMFFNELEWMRRDASTRVH